jgi:hypothetical protein
MVLPSCIRAAHYAVKAEGTIRCEEALITICTGRRRRENVVVSMTEARRDGQRFVYMDCRAQARASPEQPPRIASPIGGPRIVHVTALASRALVC